MSQVNFANLTDKHPEYRELWETLSLWIAERSGVKEISLDRLARELSEYPPGKLSRALGVLCDEGQAKEKYKVVDPHAGVLLEDSYDTPESVPDVIQGRMNGPYYEKSDVDIVPVYVLQ